jgi:NADH-quinone oxidoreductase subunit N
MLIGISSGSIEGIYATFFYAFLYIVMGIATFSILLSIRKKDTHNKLKYINVLSGLFISNPFVAFSFALILFSMCGLPPLAGFFSKLFVFVSAVNVGMYPLAIAGVMTSVIASFYYIRVIKVMFFESTIKNNNLNTFSKSSALFLSFCSFFLLCFFLWPTPLALIIHNSIIFLCI